MCGAATSLADLNVRVLESIEKALRIQVSLPLLYPLSAQLKRFTRRRCPRMTSRQKRDLKICAARLDGRREQPSGCCTALEVCDYRSAHPPVSHSSARICSEGDFDDARRR